MKYCLSGRFLKKYIYKFISGSLPRANLLDLNGTALISYALVAGYVKFSLEIWLIFHSVV